MAFEIVDNLPGAITAFEDGRADVFLWEHFTTQPVVDQGAFRRVGDFAAPWPAWVLCARQAILKDRRGQIERLFADVCRRAGGLAAAADSVDLIATRFGLKRPAVEEWLGDTEWVSDMRSPEPALAAAREMLQRAAAI
jgi:hypothetical protein